MHVPSVAHTSLPRQPSSSRLSWHPPAQRWDLGAGRPLHSAGSLNSSAPQSVRSGAAIQEQSICACKVTSLHGGPSQNSGPHAAWRSSLPSPQEGPLLSLFCGRLATVQWFQRRGGCSASGEASVSADRTSWLPHQLVAAAGGGPSPNYSAPPPETSWHNSLTTATCAMHQHLPTVQGSHAPAVAEEGGTASHRTAPHHTAPRAIPATLPPGPPT